MSNPMEQFEVKELIPLKFNGYDISFTNSSLFMCLAVVSCVLLFALCLKKRAIVPGKGQAFAEMIYDFVHNLMRENIGAEGLKYFGFIFSLFLFIACGNVLGLFPYAFTFTSHIAAVGTLSLTALIFNMIIGIKKKKWGYIRTFMPKGIPWILAPLIMPIETISLLSKPFSLTIRLVANMTVGHIMLKIIAGFIVGLGALGFVPLLFDAGIIVFELFIALLQAFIYTVLSCIYLGDAIHNH
ncbi:MAG: F0F1 ATP synthase subunit A [Alphaproteobacteria bacterium]|nr:F0F1 ATP synthase subunit A [Alphaproteobacteria bacterium]